MLRLFLVLHGTNGKWLALEEIEEKYSNRHAMHDDDQIRQSDSDSYSGDAEV